MDIKTYLEQKRQDVDRFLESIMPAEKAPPATLHKAMRYSLFAGGKRVRPILAIAACEAIRGTSPLILPLASTLELIHTYSLIHDDLPAMDNDDYRRGKLTNHKVFGEAMAILAGDALLTMAFDLASRLELVNGLDPRAQVQVIQELAAGSGNVGMVGGQVADIEAEGKDIDLATLEGVHRWKTGKLVGAAVTRCLLERGVDVRVLVRRDSDLRNLEGLKVEQAYGDLRDVASLRLALAGCRQLYHVAAHYALWAPDPQIFYDINVTGTHNLMEAARDSGVERIVYTSTIGAIGLPPGGGAGSEETPVSLKQMVGHYKRSKFLAEQEVRKLARAGLPVVIVNPSAPVGARDIKPTPTGQVIVDFMKGRMPAYIETGMNLVDVDDVAVGHRLAMEKGRIGERYILGNRNLMLREVFAILSRLTGVPAPTIKLPRWSILPLAYANQWPADYVTHRPPRIPLEGVKMAKYVMHYDCSKALRELGLPQTPVEVALEKAVRWFRDHSYA